ncbi:MAG: PQQ-binding-like beta-propeller repeat protein [Thermoleophilia bacterium]|nr:PQQ-binding-like beta-propeller repeat protein [Thermoleophilia bacterium]
MTDDQALDRLAAADPVDENALPAPGDAGPARVLSAIVASTPTTKPAPRLLLGLRPLTAVASLVVVAAALALASPPGQGAVRSLVDEIRSVFAGEGAVVRDDGPVQPLRADGIITSAVADGRGGWFVAGGFTRINGERRAHLAHLLADGSIDPDWTPSLAGRAPAHYTWARLALADGRLYVAGTFEMVNGERRGQVVALDAATGAIAPEWRGLVDAVDALTTVAVSSGRLWVGLGGGALVAGEPVRCLVVLDGQTGVPEAAIRPALEPSGDLPCVQAIVANAGRVYVAGHFPAVDGTQRPGIAALDSESGRLLAAFDPPALACDGCFGPPGATALALSGGRLYVGGFFTGAGGEARSSLLALDPATGSLQPFAAEISRENGSIATVLNLAAAGDRLYVGGDFGSVDGQARNGFAVLGPSGELQQGWQPESTTDYVLALATARRVVLAAGAGGRR